MTSVQLSRARLGQAALAGAVLALGACTRPVASPAPFPIATDRPTVAATASLVPAGRVLVEAGVSSTVPSAGRTLTYGEAVIRYGLRPRVELLLGLPSLISPSGAGTDAGFADALLGTRLDVLAANPETPVLPALALLATATIPTGSETWSAGAVQPAATLLAAWALPRSLGLTANVGVLRQAGGTTLGTGAAALGVPFAGRGTGYLELAQFRSAGEWSRPLLTAGLTWLATPQLQIDAYARRELRGGIPVGSIGLGVARGF